MEKLLHKDTVFWVVKPQIGREGISGLGTLLVWGLLETAGQPKGSEMIDPICSTRHRWPRPMRKAIHDADSKKAGSSPRKSGLFRGYGVGWLNQPWIRKNAISVINCSSMHLMTDW